MSFKDSEIDLRQLVAVQTALEFLLRDMFTRLYLLSVDPTEEATNHRARVAAELSTAGRVPALRPDAEIMARMIAEAADGILEFAGRAASNIAVGDGR